MKTVKKRSQLQEKSVAKTFNSRTVVASGALWGAKADVRNSFYLIECKTTLKDYYSVKSSIWCKIQREANRDRGRIPLLVVDLEDTERYVIFDVHTFDKEPENIGVIPNKDSHSFMLRGVPDCHDALKYTILSSDAKTKTIDLFVMRDKDFREFYYKDLEV